MKETRQLVLDELNDSRNMTLLLYGVGTSL